MESGRRANGKLLGGPPSWFEFPMTWAEICRSVSLSVVSALVPVAAAEHRAEGPACEVSRKGLKKGSADKALLVATVTDAQGRRRRGVGMQQSRLVWFGCLLGRGKESGREDLPGRVGEKLDEKDSVHRPAHQRSDPIQGWLRMGRQAWRDSSRLGPFGGCSGPTPLLPIGLFLTSCRQCCSLLWDILARRHLPKVIYMRYPRSPKTLTLNNHKVIKP